jgi:hypothetical protein
LQVDHENEDEEPNARKRKHAARGRQPLLPAVMVDVSVVVDNGDRFYVSRRHKEIGYLCVALSPTRTIPTYYHHILNKTEASSHDGKNAGRFSRA